MRAKRSVEARKTRHINAKGRCGESLHPRFPAGAAVCAILLFFCSCGGEAPQILQNSWELTMSKDRGSGVVTTSLGVFVQVDDADGISDITDLYLISDKEELFFHVGAEEWTERERTGEIWIGTTSFMMPDRGAFPAGTYRILILDKAGERSETEIYLPKQRADAPRFPGLSVKDGNVALTGAFPKAAILLFDTEGEYIRSESVEPKPRKLILSEEDGDLVDLYVYVKDETSGIGLLHGPYSFSRESVQERESTVGAEPR